MVDAINGLDYFKNSELPTTYDFNNDGKVDVADYNKAVAEIKDADDTYEGFSLDDLNSVFASVLKETSGSTEVTADNAEATARKIAEEIKSGIADPKNAKTLNELQDMGRTLTKYIKQCADIIKILDAQIKVQEEELASIQEERELREKEYANKEAAVAAKSEELSETIVRILAQSQTLSQERQQKANAAIISCIDAYKRGEYPDQKLETVIANRLGSVEEGFSVTVLNSLLSKSTTQGDEIKVLCDDITSLVGDMRNITQKYNSKNEELNASRALRADTIEASNMASQQYQSGYQRRLDMRKAIVDQYYVKGNGDVTGTNEQVQKLGEFLDNKMFDTMPFADAWAIMTTTFDNCGIRYNNETGAITVPKGHDGAATNIYNAFVKAIKENYAKDVLQAEEPKDPGFEDDEDVPGVTTITRSDPISFVSGDTKFEFVKDKNNNQIMDDASEFLGAASGWEEMVALDTDGDGIVSAKELKDIKLVAINQKDGKYTFMSAEEAGIESINLNSYKNINQKEINNDITMGTFDIKMANGTTIEGKQTLDTGRNIQNTYSNIFGQEIKDLSENYEENPFMEEFEERVNTGFVVTSTSESIKTNKAESDAMIATNERFIDQRISTEASIAESDKAAKDRETKRQEEKQLKKEEAKKLAEEEAALEEAAKEKAAKEEEKKANKEV